MKLGKNDRANTEEKIEYRISFPYQSETGNRVYDICPISESERSPDVGNYPFLLG